MVKGISWSLELQFRGEVATGVYGQDDVAEDGRAATTSATILVSRIKNQK